MARLEETAAPSPKALGLTTEPASPFSGPFGATTEPSQAPVAPPAASPLLSSFGATTEPAQPPPQVLTAPSPSIDSEPPFAEPDFDGLPLAASASPAEAISVEPAPLVRAPSAPEDEPEPRRSRRPLLLAVAAAAVVIGGTAVFALRQSGERNKSLTPDDSALVAALEKVDARMAAGRLAEPGGDAALDHLRAAAAAAPTDERVKTRQTNLAARFEQRAKDALARNDDAEAAVQLQALSLTDPQRPGVKQQLADVEDRVRSRAKR